MTQMLTLSDSPTESISCLEDSDFGAMLQQDVRGSQSCKASTDDAYTHLP